MEEEVYKINWLSMVDGKIRTFAFTEYVDDPVNRRYIFHNTDNDKILTLNYDDTAHMITAPVNE